MKRLFGIAFGVGIWSAAILAVADPAYASNWVVRLAAASQGEAHSQAVPVAPSGVTSTCQTPASAKQLKVTWSAVTHATSYQVWQSHNSGAYSSVATATTTSWTSASGLATGTYSYEIKALIGTNWVSVLSSPTTSRTISSNSPYCA